jgi:hypothetical protein
MRKVHGMITAFVLLCFIDILLLMDYLRGPYFVLAGLSFVGGWPAYIVVLGISCGIGIGAYRVLRLQDSAYYGTVGLLILLLLNSIAGLAALNFAPDDLAGFLEGVRGSGDLSGYTLFHILLSLATTACMVTLILARPILRRSSQRGRAPIPL